MIPRLVHPVVVVVEQVDPAEQSIDPVFQQPIGAPPKRTFTLRGQVKTVRSQPLTVGAGGATSMAASDGHVTFEASALTAAGVTLRGGDVITSEGGFPVRHRILRVEPHGTYGGVHHLVMAFFARED